MCVCVCFLYMCAWNLKKWLSFKDATQGESSMSAEELFMSVSIFNQNSCSTAKTTLFSFAHSIAL